MSLESSNPEEWRVVPSGTMVEGRLRPPASKSLTQRFLNLALLSTGRTELVRPLIAEDTSLFLAALERIGMSIESGPSQITFEPQGGRDECELRCGNNGTMLRFLLGSLTTMPGIWVIDGSPRLRERPVGPLVDALRQLGARIDYLGVEGFAPLRVYGGNLGEGEVLLDAGTSSQFASSVLMAATRARGEVLVELAELTSAPYLQLTIASMAEFGAQVEVLDSRRLKVRPSEMKGGRYSVEPDFSAAAYPAVAALLTRGSVLLEGLSASSKQGDLRFIELIGRIGADIEWTGKGVLVRGQSEISGLDVDLSTMPDQVPTLAALAPFASGRTRIRNVAHLRYKESDRLDAMSRELTRLGADIEQRDDGLVIEGTWAEQAPPETNVRVRTYGDHRIAMSLALVGLRRPGVEISEPEVVKKSYPDFWRDLEGLIAR